MSICPPTDAPTVSSGKRHFWMPSADATNNRQLTRRWQERHFDIRTPPSRHSPWRKPIETWFTEISITLYKYLNILVSITDEILCETVIHCTENPAYHFIGKVFLCVWCASWLLQFSKQCSTSSHTDGDIIIEPVSETIIDRHVDAFFYVYLARFDWVLNNIFTLLSELLSFFTSNRRMASS